MKNIYKIFGIIACTFVLVLSSALMTACGVANPYSLKDITLKMTEEVYIVWDSSATQQDKEEFWQYNGVSNDQEYIEKMVNSDSFNIIKSASYNFLEDGKVIISINDSTEEPVELYYKQSDDLKIVDIYTDAELTLLNYYGFVFRDGSFMMNIPDSNYPVNLCIKAIKN